jgi:hypothetical protein
VECLTAARWCASPVLACWTTHIPAEVKPPMKMHPLFLLLVAATAAAGPDPQFVATAKANVVRDFKDPSSAQWRGLYVSKAGTAAQMLCGEVNAKNSLGGYVGFRRFYAMGEPLMTTVEGGRNGEVLPIMWPKVCEDTSTPVE